MSGGISSTSTNDWGLGMIVFVPAPTSKSSGSEEAPIEAFGTVLYKDDGSFNWRCQMVDTMGPSSRVTDPQKEKAIYLAKRFIQQSISMAESLVRNTTNHGVDGSTGSGIRFETSVFEQAEKLKIEKFGQYFNDFRMKFDYLAFLESLPPDYPRKGTLGSEFRHWTRINRGDNDRWPGYPQLDAKLKE